MTDAPNSAPTRLADADRITRFFDAIRSAAIIRHEDRWIAGVCGGLANRSGIPPLLVRIVFVILGVFGAPVVFFYVAGWALLPDSTGRIHAEEAVRGRFEPVMILIGALLLFSFVPFAPGSWWQNAPNTPGVPTWLSTTLSVIWSLAVTAGIIWIIVYLARRSPTTPPTAPPASTSMTSVSSSPSVTPSPSLNPSAAEATGQPGTWDAAQAQDLARQEQYRARQAQNQVLRDERAAARRARRPGAGFTAIVLGIALMSGAIVALAASTGDHSPAAIVFGVAVALGVLALGMIVSGFRGRESGALGGYAFLAVVALLVAGVFPPGMQFVLIGSPTWHVTASSGTAENSGYALLLGQATLDLSALDERSLGETRGGTAREIDVWVAVGQTRIDLPENAPVIVETSAFVGGVDYPSTLPGQNQQGVLLHNTRSFNENGRGVPTVVRVWSWVGQVSITSPTLTGEVLP